MFILELLFYLLCGVLFYRKEVKNGHISTDFSFMESYDYFLMGFLILFWLPIVILLGVFCHD